jgi:hypothetical protein
MTREPDVGLEKPGQDRVIDVNPAAQGRFDASSPYPPPPYIVQAPAKRTGLWLVLFSLIFVFGFMAALAGGFIYGEFYGRRHANYNDPNLRNHYAGQCLDYMSREFSTVVRDTLGRELSGPNSNLQKLAIANTEITEIRDMMVAVQQDLQSLSQSLQLRGASTNGASHESVMKNVKRLIALMEQNQIQLVADRCPASPSVPKRYSSRDG